MLELGLVSPAGKPCQAKTHALEMKGMVTTESPTRAVNTDVLLMMTCLCDAFYAGVAEATVRVLEAAGCRVHFPEDQTCCGQPAFNGGDFESSRKVAKHTAQVFAGDLPIIVPSGSCAAMHLHGNALQFEKSPAAETASIRSLANRTWEVCDFLVHGLGKQTWPGRLQKRIALHDSCHTRGSGTGAAMRVLLGAIDGVELVEIGQAEQCCGFGGTFSVTFPHVSAGMGTLKLDEVLAKEPDLLVSGDMSCLMHLNGLAEKQERKLPHRHAVEILAEALPTSSQ